MPIIKCPDRMPCIDPSTPVTNFSTEAPDPNEFLSLQWPPINPDNPVGGGPGPNVPPHVWDADGCQSECVSTISQQDADLCAAMQAELCVLGKSGGVGPQQTIFLNDTQTCSATCADGSVIEATVAAGTIAAATKASANAQAHAKACSELSAGVRCGGCFAPTTLPQPQIAVPYTATFTANAGLVPPFSWQVVSGSLPPGLSLNEQTGVLSGTPTLAGTYNFTISLQTQAT